MGLGEKAERSLVSESAELAALSAKAHLEHGDQLAKLEDSLGKLPDTWTSSARSDGISGIRYFRVPCGLAFRGQVDKDIECIYKGYRFVIVWPSTNPDHGGETYWWYPPGNPPAGKDTSPWDGSTVPKVSELPELPSKWVDYLTQGRN